MLDMGLKITFSRPSKLTAASGSLTVLAVVTGKSYRAVTSSGTDILSLANGKRLGDMLSYLGIIYGQTLLNLVLIQKIDISNN